MFRFLDPGQLVDDDLALVLAATKPAEPSNGLVPVYIFTMIHQPTSATMGSIQLRAGNTDMIQFYAGHIGYAIEPRYRGHRYAARSCRLLFPLARAHTLDPLWITCNPENIASRRTCELAGGRLVDIVELPPGSSMYDRGERRKCRYRIEFS